MVRSALCMVSLCLLSWRAASADEVRIVDEGGVTYQETKRVVRRPISEMQVQPRERTVYHPKVTTELQSISRTYNVPVTNQQWIPCWQRSWNPFRAPELVYRQVPCTTWQTRNETVRIPVSKTEMVPTTVVDQVPVTTQRFVEDTYVSRVAIGAKPIDAAASTASRADGKRSLEPKPAQPIR